MNTNKKVNYKLWIIFFFILSFSFLILKLFFFYKFGILELDFSMFVTKPSIKSCLYNAEIFEECYKHGQSDGEDCFFDIIRIYEVEGEKIVFYSIEGRRINIPEIYHKEIENLYFSVKASGGPIEQISLVRFFCDADNVEVTVFLDFSALDGSNNHISQMWEYKQRFNQLFKRGFILEV